MFFSDQVFWAHSLLYYKLIFHDMLSDGFPHLFVDFQVSFLSGILDPLVNANVCQRILSLIFCDFRLRLSNVHFRGQRFAIFVMKSVTAYFGGLGDFVVPDFQISKATLAVSSNWMDM
jgi:hypothetical protein